MYTKEPMDKRINDLVEMFFEDIPYSEEVMKAREKIKAALSQEYAKLSEKLAANEAFELLLEKYGRLSDLAVLAGYPAEAVEKWRSPGKVTGLKEVKKEVRSQRKRIWLISLLWLSGIIYLLGIVLYENIVLILFSAAFAAAGYLAWKRYRKREIVFTTDRRYDTDSYLFLRRLSDQYTKRVLNGIALLAAVTVSFLLVEWISFGRGNSKMSEFLESITVNIIIFEVPLYLCIKNTLWVGLAQRRIHQPDKEQYQKHWMGVAVFSTVYWVVTGIICLIFQKKLQYPANVILLAGVLFGLTILFYNLMLRRKIVYKNMAFNRARVIVFSTAVILVSVVMMIRRDTWYTQPYINATPVVEHNENAISYDEASGVYTITSSADEFKILHLTDIHLGGSLYSYRKDMKALKAVYAEISYTKPDLVVVTGDLTFPLGIMSMSLNNSAPVNQFAAFMRNIDIPWVFTYGNHDTEGLATLSKSDLNALYMQLSYKTSGNLLYPYVQPEVTGRNNQLVEIRNSDGTLNQAIFLLDSNAYTGEGINVYDYIHDDQVEWYASQVERLSEEEGHTISSMAFFHIPLQQYRTAYELYEAGSDEVKYFFGENGEKMMDKVCCSDYPSRLFDTMLALGSTKAVFCGHDHYNNMSLEYKGIRLTYGMSIDYLAMPGIEKDTKQRGAELITLYPDSSWEIEQIPLLSIEKQGNRNDFHIR